jgi:hypothetical protein
MGRRAAPLPKASGDSGWFNASEIGVLSAGAPASQGQSPWHERPPGAVRTPAARCRGSHRGHQTPGEGITIYPIQSPALKDFEARALARLAGTDDTTPSASRAHHAADVNEPGTLAQVAR